MPKKVIVQDGKTYIFEPGRNGGMVAHPNEPNSYQFKRHADPLEFPLKSRAKTIGPKKNIDVGSTRG